MDTPIKSTRLIKTHGCTTVMVNEGDPNNSYGMSIPAGDPDDNGSLGWRLVYQPSPCREDMHCAVSIMESYEYLLSGNIPASEAINRLRCLRRAYREQFEGATS